MKRRDALADGLNALVPTACTLVPTAWVAASTLATCHLRLRALCRRLASRLPPPG
jgi:hypothetical protein